MSHGFLSALDPALLTGARDCLGETFSHGIFEVIPEISDFVEFETESCVSSEAKARYQRAAQKMMASRRDLQTRLTVLFAQHFDEKLNHLAGRSNRNSRHVLDKLTLVGHDKLDEEIAVNHCSRRLKEQCQFELWALTQRLCILLGKEAITDQENPAFPQVFAQVLMSAMSELEPHPEVRLSMFKAFGPVLLDIAPETYNTANDFLVARGIEVEAEEFYGAPRVTPMRAFSNLPSAQQVVITATQGLALTLQQLAAIAGQAQRGNDAGTGHAGAEPVWTEPLQDLERKMIQQSGTESERVLHHARAALRGQMDPEERVIADVITAMFDKLNADPRVAPALKAIINRLQIPVLETALRDRTVFSQADHPVRKLIDLIAEFGLTVAETNEETALQSIASVVDGLVRVHASGKDALEQAYCQLDDLYYHHEEAALQNDARVRRLEDSESLVYSELCVDREIALRMQGWLLPVSVNTFIRDVWREVLVRDFENGGAKGRSWKLGLAALEELLNSLRPAHTPEDRQRLVKALPSLLGLIRDDVGDAGFDPGQIDQFFAELQRMHARVIRGEPCTEIGVRFESSPELFEIPAGQESVSNRMAQTGLACGDWIESREARGSRRWRLNWITPIRGTCVLKNYESRTVETMPLEDLRERMVRGEMIKVAGLGLAEQALKDAMLIVGRKLKRESGSVPAADLTRTDRNLAAMQAVAV